MVCQLPAQLYPLLSYYGGHWPQPNGNNDRFPIFLQKYKEVTDKEFRAGGLSEAYESRINTVL
jgi:hypothetical protein